MYKFLVVGSDTRFGRFKVGEKVGGVKYSGPDGALFIEITRSPKLIVEKCGDGFWYASGVPGLKLKLVKVVKPKLEKRDTRRNVDWGKLDDKRIVRRMMRQMAKPWDCW